MSTMRAGVRAGVLRPGDRVEFDGSEHLVLGLAGSSVRLRSSDGCEQVMLASHLLSSPSFTLLDHDEPRGVEPFGLSDSLPVDVLDGRVSGNGMLSRSRLTWCPDAEPGAAPREGFDPASTTVSQRAEAKAAELG